MSEPRDARQVLELAERAAIDGDFSSADQLLRELARIQEAELGPLHPDLAKTLNNLAVIAEKTERPHDAETFYRRAATIASASLPADHPMVVESRQNLESFCRERGLPITTPAQPPTAAAAQSPRPAPPESPRLFAWGAVVAIGAIVLITGVVLLVRRPLSPRETSTDAVQTTAPAAQTSVVPAPIEQAPPPEVAPPREVAPPTEVAPPPEVVPPPAPSPSSGTISLATAELCQTFSTSGGRWQCEPAGDSVAQGPLVLYTRIRSPRDATVVHRWYRDDTLRQERTLAIRANASEGYRTYSRQTVDAAGNWRVEVRDSAGELLHEKRFLVQ